VIGRLKDLSFGRNGEQHITLTVKTDFCEEFDRLKDHDVSFEIKRHRKSRSLDANAYAWVLIDRIASASGEPKETVYREAIRNIGGVSEIVCVQDRAKDALCRLWESKGIGWLCEELPSKLNGCTNMVLYAGSSAYDTAQMSLLIDRLIQDAKALGIPTETPDQIAERLSLWDNYIKKHTKRKE
jgi:hypothetical protein